MTASKTVASVSFHSNQNLSMDVDEVLAVSMSEPISLGVDQWVCELIIRSANGTLAINMLSAKPANFMVNMADPGDHNA